MIYTNHSCDPNIAVQGQIVFVAMRDIDAGEELTHDWATTDDLDYVMDCRCGSARCRGTVTGRDWRKRALQDRYRGRFCWFLQRKIDALTPRSPRLRYRALSGNEVALFHRLIVNEHVRRYLLDGKIMPESWSATEAEASERRHEEGLGLWLVSAAHRPDDVLGFCGYRVFADLDPRPQLLFAFVESATGQGFATETARAMIRLGRVAGLESIIAFVDAPNVASIRVLKKVGFVSTTAGPCTIGQRLCFEVNGAHKA